MPENESNPNPADAAHVNENLKNRTMRISLDSVRPPKATPNAKNTTAVAPDGTAHAAPFPQTIRLKRPPTAPITLPPIERPAPSRKTGDTEPIPASNVIKNETAETVVKRQTTRIGLNETTPPKSPTDLKRSTGPIMGIPMHAVPIPQTIRLKRPATGPIKRPPTAPIIAPPLESKVTTHMEQAVAEEPVMTEAPTVIKRAIPKVPTARIVLDTSPVQLPGTVKPPTAAISTLTPTDLPEPKTIRLKRPSAPEDAEAAIQITATDETLTAAPKAETSKIAVPLEDNAQTTMTQRKTIKIKRTDRSLTPRPTTPPAVAGTQPDVLLKTPAVEEDPALLSPIVACAAMLCMAALVYIMVAQACGVHLLLPATMQLH